MCVEESSGIWLSEEEEVAKDGESEGVLDGAVDVGHGLESQVAAWETVADVL